MGDRQAYWQAKHNEAKSGELQWGLLSALFAAVSIWAFTYTDFVQRSLNYEGPSVSDSGIVSLDFSGGLVQTRPYLWLGILGAAVVVACFLVTLKHAQTKKHALEMLRADAPPPS